MKRWKWILATAALMIGGTGGAFAQEQRWGNPRDTDGSTYAQRYESNRNYNRTYSRNDSYRGRDGYRDDQGYWRQSRKRDNRNQDQSRRDRQERGRDRD